MRLITANLARSVIGHRPSHLISAGDLAAINQRRRGPLWRCQSGPFTQRHQQKEFTLSDGRLELTSKLHGGPLEPGATPTISANGNKDGIVWTISGRTWEIIPEKIAVLHAFDALDVARELYNSDQNSDRDRAGISVRFSIPTVVNGRVYIGTRSELDLYGLLTARPR